jgi:predicted PurR-regulated permease PerM
MQFDLARLILAIIAIVGLMLLSMWILSPFFTAMIWALMIVVASWPLLIRLQTLLRGRRGLAVTVMTLLMLLIFIVPLVLAVQTLIENADTLVRWGKLAANFEVPPPPDWLATLPMVGSQLVDLWTTLREAGLESLIKRAAPYAGRAAQWAASNAGTFGLLIVHFLLTVIVAAVMFAQGEEGAQRVLRLAQRVGGAQGEEAVRLAASAIRGVAIAVVGTALIQTLLAGVGLAVAGVPFAGLLTAVALILCIAQLGPGLVLIPAIVWLYWSGETGWGTFLLVWSVIAMTVDNFVRPVLVRFGADLPLLLIFAGVMGGLLSMGLVGLFVGPVVLAVTWRLFEAWANQDQAGSNEVAAVAAPPPPVETDAAMPTVAETQAQRAPAGAGASAPSATAPPAA